MYRQEHPKPQFRRDNWLNLNGTWDFCYDNGSSGKERKLYLDENAFDLKIEVPFCPQSKLSGIENKEFMHTVWYRRFVDLNDAQRSGRIFLHFGAVDYAATVYVNGQNAGSHKGGYVSWKLDITDYTVTGKNVIILCVDDNERDPMIPSGKQCFAYYSVGCHYTRTTGIWQTVWLEFTPDTYIKNFRLNPDVANCAVNIHVTPVGAGTVKADVSFEGKAMGSAEVKTDGEQADLHIALTEQHLWELGKGNLYDVTLTLGNDTVHTYFGLRSIDYRDYKFYLNGKSVYQRLVLDQGFYPDGIYTAPSDAELAADIDRSMAMGFNGARLHEKIFEERFLYHADRKGYMVWGEYPNWGLDHTRPECIYGFLGEWLEEIDRDVNHPAIVGWCPLNETWDFEGRQQFNPFLDMVYRATKAADATRPCIDTSGNYHVVTDIYDVHNYTQDPAELATYYDKLDQGICKEYAGGRQE